jgi:hypothetical protein
VAARTLFQKICDPGTNYDAIGQNSTSAIVSRRDLDRQDAQMLMVVRASAAEGLQVDYLTESLPATPELFAAATPAKPTVPSRSTLSRSGLQAFDGAKCQLATRITAILDPVVSALPRCAIRPVCRWFRQEGREACLRCPQVATEQRNASELQRSVAG